MRIGLGYVASVGEDDAAALVAERDGPHASSPTSAISHVGLHFPATRSRRLIRGGACDSLGGRRRDLLWELGLALRPVTVKGSRGESKQLTLALEPTVETPELRELTRWERMLADYRETGLSVAVHPLPAAPLASPGRDAHERRARGAAARHADRLRRDWRSRVSARRPQRGSCSCCWRMSTVR